MQMHQPSQNTLAVSGGQGTTRFGMDVNAHMFRILSDGLYSDKISAVLREIACNAYDAHVMVGKQSLPIEVRLPGELSPNFHVKDWGPGLSEDQVRELYSTYGRSTKQGDENTTGGFGLGSKSPFAYTDQFTITSAHQGVMRTFIAHKDEEEPRITLMSTEAAPEDWQNGVMVSLVIRPDDFLAFRARAAELFRWFEVRPNLVAGLDVVETIKERDEEWIQVGNYRVLSNKPGKNQAYGASVVMANVRYPIKLSELDLTEAESARISGFSPILKVPNGTVMPTPSREGIQYTRESKAFLSKAFGSDFWSALIQHVVKQVDDHLDANFSELYEVLSPIRQASISYNYHLEPLRAHLQSLSHQSKDSWNVLGKLSDETKRAIAYRKATTPSAGRSIVEDTRSSNPQIRVEGFYFRGRTGQVCSTVSRNPEVSETQLGFDKPSIVVYEDCASGKTLAKLFLRSLNIDEHGMAYVSDEAAKYTKKGPGSKILNEVREHAEAISKNWYLSLGKVYSTSEIKALLGWEPSKAGSKAKAASSVRAIRIAREEVMTTDLITPEVEQISDIEKAASDGSDIVWFQIAQKVQLSKVKSGRYRRRYLQSLSLARNNIDMPRDIATLAQAVSTLKDVNPHLKSPLAKDVKFVVLSAAQVKRIKPEELGWTHVEKYLTDRLASLDPAPLLAECQVPTDPALIDAYVTAGTSRLNISMIGRTPRFGWLYSVLGCTHGVVVPSPDKEVTGLAQEVHDLIQGTQLEEIRDTISKRIQEMPNVDSVLVSMKVATLKAIRGLAGEFGLKDLLDTLSLADSSQDAVLSQSVEKLKQLSAINDEMVEAYMRGHPYRTGLLQGPLLNRDMTITYLQSVLDRLVLIDQAKAADQDQEKLKPLARVKKHPRRIAADARQMALDLFEDQRQVEQSEAA